MIKYVIYLIKLNIYNLELNKIKFQGSVLEKPSWVNFHTSWQEVLMRVTQAGQVEPKRMAQLFRENIPDAFIKDFLQGKRCGTWQASYDAVILALTKKINGGTIGLEDRKHHYHLALDLLEHHG